MTAIKLPFVLMTVMCEVCNKDEMYCWCFHSGNWIKLFKVFPIYIALISIPIIILLVIFTIYKKYKLLKL